MIKNPSRIARNVTDDSPLIENLKSREQVASDGDLQKWSKSGRWEGKGKGEGEGMHSSE